MLNSELQEIIHNAKDEMVKTLEKLGRDNDVTEWAKGVRTQIWENEIVLDLVLAEKLPPDTIFGEED
jgi:hypothetical protein